MSLLQLPDAPLPSWARFGRYGEGGSFGFQMDASGLENRNRMMHRDLIPATADVTFQIRLRMTSSLVTSNPAFEGLAVRLRGFQLEGSQPASTDRQVWDSNPSAGGIRAWISGQYSEFETHNFMINIPSGLGIDYVTVELVVRAQSGQVNIDNFECRHYYGKLYPIEMQGFQSWTTESAFTVEVFSQPISGDTFGVRRWVRYLFTEDIVVRKGQTIITNLRTLMSGRAFEFTNAALTEGGRIPALTGVVLKFRRKGTGTYDYMDAGAGYATREAKTFSINETRQRRAPYDYDQVELIVFNEPEPSSESVSHGSDRLSFEDIDLDIIVADFIAPSQ